MSVYSYTHPVLDEQIRAIGGHYTFTRELRMALDGREVLAFVGYGIVDTSCCGVGGCTYALVPGFIEAYGISKTDDGRIVSRVDAIDDAAHRRTLTRIFLREHQIQQVNFFSP
jgi:hypothetical protein